MITIKIKVNKYPPYLMDRVLSDSLQSRTISHGEEIAEWHDRRTRFGIDSLITFYGDVTDPEAVFQMFTFITQGDDHTVEYVHRVIVNIEENFKFEAHNRITK